MYIRRLDVVMGKTLSLKLNDKELRKVSMVFKENDMTPSELLRKALWTYVNEVNQVNQKVNLSQQEKHDQEVNQKVNQVNQKVNLSQQETEEKSVNQKVNPVQIVDNYELIEYLKRNEEWLKDRIEHFENTQDKIIGKIDTTAKKKPLLSWVRM